MGFSQIQPWTWLNIGHLIQNYLVRALKICDSLSGYKHFSKNSNTHTHPDIFFYATFLDVLHNVECPDIKIYKKNFSWIILVGHVRQLL